MTCLYCGAKTRILNSRKSKDKFQTWRRHHCSICKKSYTTYERISLIDELRIQGEDGTMESYNPGALLQDLVNCLSPKAIQDRTAYFLMRTIEDSLSLRVAAPLKINDYHSIVHASLFHFDALAGIQYAARHKLKHLL